ncbi:MAG: DNA mismatch repair endonuclease MutL [Clostridia bacterium]|nr:DNA mismatch repair endonuclease MutL [Clostridia bacterium]
MNRIRVLSAHIANQIAAGEVIERPASIVKELVENAVDAGATAVTVEIENGGLDGIRVTDNGAGIADEDTEAAFLRHATSKLRRAEDLSRIETLGFRGEALASIAAVSCVTMRTRRADAELGSELRLRGGELLSHSGAGCAAGTVMEVRELFFNAPARLKFLKSARAESGAIGEHMAKLILSLPDVAFRFVNNGKTVYQSGGDGDLQNAILCVYGIDAAPQLLKIGFDDGYLKITGYCGTPELSRFNRQAQTFVLNRRVIRSAALSNALSRAYDTRLMIGRFPFAVLHMQIASAEVDVNVHPAKLEVRFRDEARVARSVNAACAEALIKSRIAPGVSLPSEAREERSSGGYGGGWQPAVRPQAGWRGFSGASGAVRLEENHQEDGAIPRIRIPAAPGEEVSASGSNAGVEPAPLAAPYSVVGCAFMTYWLVQQGETLYCIDQHAAHERLLYDRLMRREAQPSSQTLLLPETVTLSLMELEILRQNREALQSFGFAFAEDTEGLAVKLLAVPQINGAALKAAFLHDALERLAEGGEASLSAQSVARAAITQAACKHAVKAGEAMRPEQLESLLRMLEENDSLLTCPHGRPVAIRINKADFEKWFKRIP